jgi:hypothetical protein
MVKALLTQRRKGAEKVETAFAIEDTGAKEVAT